MVELGRPNLASWVSDFRSSWSSSEPLMLLHGFRTLGHHGRARKPYSCVMGFGLEVIMVELESPNLDRFLGA